ncbi:MAG: PIN domain-containing protein [Desulfobacteraceae bacterium]|nr:PIN domain-containing protein [Desulfobacteraceae bacterium]MBC2719011.1 hypothetical protein [Desulfobacteraceae bacterium]
MISNPKNIEIARYSINFCDLRSNKFDPNHGITEDPKDDMFIACALERRADYIVSRDPHLRNIKHFQGIQVIDVTTFIEKVKKR